MTDQTPLVDTFVGERFADVDALSALISPPYDVISGERREAFASQHEHNVVRLILPDGGDDRYAEAARTADAWRAAATLVSEGEPGVYVLQQTFTTPDGDKFTRTGLIAALAAEAYDGGRVRPHEKTHKGPKEDRLALMRSTRTMFEALLMLAPDADRALIEHLLAVAKGEPIARATLEGVEMALWFAGGETGSEIAALASRSDIYIADGHHRYETAVAYRNENPASTHTLALIVPQSDRGLVVLPTHRLLAGHLGTSEARDFVDASWALDPLPAADVADAAKSLEAGCIIVCRDGALVAREKTDVTLARVGVNFDERVGRLNIARVDAMVVNPLQRALDASLTYSPDVAEVIRAVEEGGTTGILVPATPVEDVIGVADARGFMPQKSTYFIPKAPSGLVMMPVAVADA